MFIGTTETGYSLWWGHWLSWQGTPYPGGTWARSFAANYRTRQIWTRWHIHSANQAKSGLSERG